MPRPIASDDDNLKKFEVEEIVIPQRKTPKKSGTLRAWRESLKRRRQQTASSNKNGSKKKKRRRTSSKTKPAPKINKKETKNVDNDSISLGESPDEEEPDEEERISEIDESDDESSDDSIDFPLIARGKRSQKEKTILQKISKGKAPPQFRDDKSGTKPMRPLTIRYALEIMEDEARRTAISQWRGRGGSKNKVSPVV
jgi:hypothetical protein